MSEELLYFVWKFGLTNPNLQTVNGENISVISSGTQNHLSGPDFTNAKIRIGDKQWYGNVEIHVKSSDWIKHGHSSDRSYDSIILHVVYENDVDLDEHIFRKVPTVELKQNIDTSFLENYERFSKQKGWITCESQINQIDEFHISSWLERLRVERLERKTDAIQHLLESNQGDWETSFIIWICTAYGFKFNTTPFELLAKKLSPKMLVNSKNLEALLLGLSGLLPTFSNDFYVNELISEFEYYRAKWKSEPMESSIWKTGGVRPPNQPVVRIVQLAGLLSKCTGGFWSTIVGLESIDELKEYVQVKPNEYWSTHYNFGASTKVHEPGISDASFGLIVINCIVPFLFTYGKSQNKEALVQRAFSLQDYVDPESNRIINNWKELGLKPANAGQSQALLELFNEYCLRKKCLICSIGNKLLRND
ncbi:MAG: hypothetical protein CL840_22355 [Crocinitomicaceae bacterium]|nr:hypothetical protein [Crocinitomicaceae bacterium]|tara:strand:- start:1135 stop:2397 length:1263 start_codon:yes stop_codon:yes gene_type:complete